MNKRSTEGYVLAYVLIVVTVMGLIAATLMTSTLQVVKAQENSIEYMKDKYEVQGELERLVADLDYNAPFSPVSVSFDSIYNSDEPRKTVHDMAGSNFAAHLNGLSLSGYPLIVKDAETKEFVASYDNNLLTLSVKLSNESITIKSMISFSPEIMISSETKYKDSEEGDGTQVFSHYQYTATVTGATDFTYSFYEITSNGGGT